MFRNGFTPAPERDGPRILVSLLCAQSIAAGYAPPSRHAFPEYKLVATAENITLHCQSRYSVVFNGTSPGPPLHLRENHTTWVRVYNHIDDENLTVHWHGLSQRTAPFSDGTPQVSQWPIAPGAFFDYEITPQIGDAGSYFYHSHVGFQAITAHGALVVEEEDGKGPPYKYDHDVPILFQDFYATNDSTIQHGLLANPFKWSGEPSAILLNGFSGNASWDNASDESCTPYVLKVLPDTTYRLRIIGGTAISLVTLGIEDHDDLTIIEADSEYTKPWHTEHVQVGSGQRFSVLLKTKSRAELAALDKTRFWVRYENRERPNNVSGYALLEYDNVAYSTALPSELPPESPVSLPREVATWAEYALEALTPTESFPTLSEVTRTVYITVRQVMRVGYYTNRTINGTLEWAQNDLVWKTEDHEANNSIPYLVQVYLTGQTPNYTAAVQNGGWDPDSNTFPALPGEVLDIVWLSNSGLQGVWDFHPMHAHGKHYFDLGSGNGTYDAVTNEARFENFTPAKRDTTLLYRYTLSGEAEHTAGWRAWRIRITEEDVGMQTVWVFGNTSEILAKFPSQPYVNGYLTYGGDAYGNGSYDPLVDLPPLDPE
ncbi:hypothetical protein DV735_g4534, partial [Chaetothyriales sp. CBS 134920]